ncbi:alpha/beta fold hydrolase [Streptomyces indicus]|uniref:Pimeloyl-ACP methyl ester carboxylesterase n=1 Tax=Streptomyces indicus TaxID=417292 RepID=A0A1G9J3F6_9ACTN|nr:alpha/beta hydrolase [Streptomyces indicus]SDL31796.1 Pimeloyl-ACP methyl ester carboxylesterase [Streptomyces indicus]
MTSVPLSVQYVPRGPSGPGIRLRYRTVHGYRRAFRMAGKGDAVLLIHGIGDSSDTWRDIMPGLARSHRVIAPDLLGHGHSDKPRADYSLAAYANGMRDLLSVLGVERATIVGHSLGGAVAMQFAYQFPERCERLVLVGTGGVGRHVTPLLRAASLPGAELALQMLHLPTMRWQVGAAVKILQWLGTDLAVDAPDLLRVVDALPDATSRNAFVRTLRAVVDWRGQVGTMLDRCYLAQGMPTMLVWGGRDRVVPALHGGLGHVSMPGSRLEIFEKAGHFPFRSDPDRFVSVLRDFIGTTEPASFSPEQWRQMLRNRRPAPRHPGVADLDPATLRALRPA